MVEEPSRTEAVARADRQFEQRAVPREFSHLVVDGGVIDIRQCERRRNVLDHNQQRECRDRQGAAMPARPPLRDTKRHEHR
jgi:hypothetical protein